MCGITGTINISDAGITAAKMAALIKHRGPDEGPIVISNSMVSCAAVRLSIVDLEHGSQPLSDNDGNIVSLNGEIYNYKELRADLQDKGYKFNSTCDTEVLLAGFAIHGYNFVKRLDGIFAISFFEARTKIMYLFRDYFGVKPLYFTQIGSSIKYSSEIKSFWHDKNKFDINIDYIIYNNVFNWSDPEATLYVGILSISPSSYLRISPDDKLEQFVYSPVGFDGVVKNFTQACNATKRNLRDAVASQIPSEVEWGVLLSGGVDSSILTLIAKEFSEKNIQTYSICSSESDSEDLISAREVAKFLGTKHEEIRVDVGDAVENYANYLYAIEDINSKFFFYYFIAKYLSTRVKVALCGEGADELYMGYPVYRNQEQFISEVKGRWAKIRHLSSKNQENVVNTIISFLGSANNEALYEVMIRSQLPWFQLNPVDKCSMAFGVEFRVPYLSLRHAIPAMNYPADVKLSGSIEKNVLRTSFIDSNLPTISRKKYFAGTRTLPSFYEALDSLATAEYPGLVKKYKNEANILSINDLYSLSLLDQKMRAVCEPDISTVLFIKINSK